MMRRFKDVAIQAAIVSGTFIKKKLGRIKEISFKGRINLVTDIDKKSERLITTYLKKVFPDYSILSEESGEDARDSDYRWVVDPLDGTTNFAHSFPFFCVSIALEKNFEPILGIVYDPLRDELFYAEKGKGASLNNKSIHVSKTNSLANSLLATGFAYRFKEIENNNIDNFINFLMVSQAIRRTGSAALDLCYVALGRFDGFWELDLQPWDTAAGSLIVKEAGGRVTRFSGLKYSHYDKDILASNGKIHTQMVKILSKRIVSNKKWNRRLSGLY